MPKGVISLLYRFSSKRRRLASFLPSILLFTENYQLYRIHSPLLSHKAVTIVLLISVNERMQLLVKD